MTLPIHPISVHFPIAFYFLELLLLVLWTIKKDPAYRRFALFAFKAACISMVVSIVTGWFLVKGFEGIQGKVKPHFFSALCLLVVSASRALLWKASKDEKNGKALLLTAVVGFAIVMLTAYFGGDMVYGED
jgi:uncharacterized membrane protein